MSDSKKRSDETREMLNFLSASGVGVPLDTDSDKVFRWALVFQIKELNTEVSHIKEMMTGIQATVTGMEGLKVQFVHLEQSIRNLERKLGDESLVEIKRAVDDLRTQIAKIKDDLVQCDIVHLNKRLEGMEKVMETMKEWQHARELLLTNDQIRMLIDSVRNNNAFQIKVTAIAAAALSGLSFLSMVFKIFGGN